jgi:hypothetical protein
LGVASQSVFGSVFTTGTDGDGDLSTGAKVGIGVGIGAAVLLLIAIGGFVVYRRKHPKTAYDEHDPSAYAEPSGSGRQLRFAGDEGMRERLTPHGRA